MHVKSWPKVKLGQVEVVSNIAQNHLVPRKSYLLIIYANSYDNMQDYRMYRIYYIPLDILPLHISPFKMVIFDQSEEFRRLYTS